jgi:hypothetical protein
MQGYASGPIGLVSGSGPDTVMRVMDAPGGENRLPRLAQEKGLSRRLKVERIALTCNLAKSRTFARSSFADALPVFLASSTYRGLLCVP